MKTLKVCLVVVLIFTAGFTAGSVATRGLTRRTIARVLSNPNHLRFIIERRLSRRLHLDANQRQQVDLILTHTQGELKSLRQQFAPQFESIMSNTQAQVSAILEPEQRERFDRLREENQFLWRVK